MSKNEFRHLLPLDWISRLQDYYLTYTALAPVQLSFYYKLLLLTYKAINGVVPWYLNKHLVFYDSPCLILASGLMHPDALLLVGVLIIWKPLTIAEDAESLKIPETTLDGTT